MDIIELIDERGQFSINCLYSSKNGVRTGKPKFVESLTIRLADYTILDEIVKQFGGKYYKVGNIYKLTYTSKKAAEVIKKILPFLSKQKDKAEILLQLSNLRLSCRAKTYQNFLLKQSLKEKLDSLK